jgi:hypothetical protein
MPYWVRSFLNKLSPNQYGTELEKYIVSRDPKTLADIEIYTLEYHRKLAQQVFN